jgi:hypothetical protein
MVSGARQAGSLTRIVHMMCKECKPKSHSAPHRVLEDASLAAGTIRAVNPRVIVPIAVLIVLAVIAFAAMRPANPVVAPASSNPEVTPPSSNSGLSINISERTLQGAVETPTPLANLRVAALIGSQVIAQTVIKDNGYRLVLPAKLENAELTGLKDVKLPNGEGRLKGDGAVGATVQFVAFDDANGNSQPDADEMSVNLVPFKAGQDAAMRGFFRYGMVIVSKAASLKETQDHPTGAENFYRYDLEFGPGWHVIEGEFASQGYEIRESTGNQFDLIVPRTPSGKGPSGLVK